MTSCCDSLKRACSAWTLQPQKASFVISHSRGFLTRKLQCDPLLWALRSKSPSHQGSYESRLQLLGPSFRLSKLQASSLLQASQPRPRCLVRVLAFSQLQASSTLLGSLGSLLSAQPLVCSLAASSETCSPQPLADQQLLSSCRLGLSAAGTQLLSAARASTGFQPLRARRASPASLWQASQPLAGSLQPSDAHQPAGKLQAQQSPSCWP